MQRLIKQEKILLILAISSAVLGALAIAGIIFFILKLFYLPMAICILITAHGFYGCPLYLMRRADIKICRSILQASDEGKCGLSQISEYAGVKPEFAEKLILRMVKKGYLSPTDGNTLIQK